MACKTSLLTVGTSLTAASGVAGPVAPRRVRSRRRRPTSVARRPDG